MVAPAMTDEQVALMASFKMAHRKESTRQSMALEREALAAMLVVRANVTKEAARVAAEEEAMHVAAHAVEAALDLAAREEVAAAEETAREAARAVAQTEELAEEATVDAATGGDGTGPPLLGRGHGRGETPPRGPLARHPAPPPPEPGSPPGSPRPPGQQ
jgi:hypothetical protein